MSNEDAEIVNEHKEQMNQLAQKLDEYFNADRPRREIGFALFVFPFDKSEGARVNYISNAARADMVAAMKEWIARVEGRAFDSDAKH